MNPLDIGLAFVEGMVLIASPCILPVLPLVLAASIDGGRARPLGVIAGFILSFTLFALLARELLTAFALDPEWIRNVSLLLLTLFGLTLLSATLSGRFAALCQHLGDVGQRFAPAKGQGFASGISIGALIGLVWTPCAGPILATVLVQVIRQQNDLAGNLVLLSFSIGAGVPMLLIALAGRRLMSHLNVLVRHAEAVRKGFAVLILLSVGLMASGLDRQLLAASPARGIIMPTASSPSALVGGLEKPYPAPAFAGIEQWFNSPPLRMEELKGKVVLIDFWTYSCINCIRTLPDITRWDRLYRDKGLVIIGVHSPEFEFEKRPENVQAAMKQFGIDYPVALDNQFATWDNFRNRYWPAHYLIDRNGLVVYTHFGEGEAERTENNIRFLLGLQPLGAPSPQHEGHSAEQTPESYLGYYRAARFAGKSGLKPDKDFDYVHASVLNRNEWSLAGSWRVEGERSVSAGNHTSLRLNFTASKVFLVLGTGDGKPAKLTLRLDGEPLGAMAGKDVSGSTVHTDSHRLYELISLPELRRGELTIEFDRPGISAYAFTFG